MKKVFFQINNGELIATETKSEKTIAAAMVDFYRNPQRVSASIALEAELYEMNAETHSEASALEALQNWESTWYLSATDPRQQNASVLKIALSL